VVVATERTRVLVVGGHPVILGVIRLACDALPDVQIVEEVDNGPDAVRAASASSPNIAVIDLDLPDIAPADLLRSVRAAGFVGHIVAVSERADGTSVLDAMRVGVDAYLVKPDGLRRIGDAIKRVLGGERVIDPALEQAAVLELGRFARQARESSEVVSSLTPREREILELLAEGLTTQQIGRRLGISPRTVETHVAKLYRKLEVRTRVQAIAKAASLGLIELR
jgi:two-component system nitrate/nitrite response regulator NarL